MSWQGWIFKKMLARYFAGWSELSFAEQRQRQQNMPLPPGRRGDLTIDVLTIEGIPAEYIQPAGHASPKNAVLYLHGGGYVVGSPASHRGWVSRLSAELRLPTLLPDYRLAPEHPFPAALEDALTAYRWLHARVGEAGQIAIVGDSAGGGLAVALLVALREAGEPRPAAAVCLSPWVDLTLSGRSIHEKAGVDVILEPRTLALYAAAYAGDENPAQPLLSPLFADLSRLPPLQIHVGEDEILLDDARRLADRAAAAGVDVQLEIWPGMFHVFPMMPFLPEASQALNKIRTFLES